jgi:splicing factor U2AF subunit
MKIPRPQEGNVVPGLGMVSTCLLQAKSEWRRHNVLTKLLLQIFIRYDNTDDSLTALKALAGRKFADRTVLASFYDEQKYEADEF